jgi:hypothetical protein
MEAVESGFTVRLFFFFSVLYVASVRDGFGLSPRLVLRTRM